MAAAKKEEQKVEEKKVEKPQKKTYVAKKRGYISALGVVEKGQKFQYAGKPGKWMEEVKKVEEKDSAKK